ncbi:Serine/threonine protein phosphatase, partial [Globisporangium splendens]
MALRTNLLRRPSVQLALRDTGRRFLCVSASSRSSNLQLVSGACELPHPQKRATGGEDAWFICSNTVGVADGVGGWARKGIDSGEYSRTLMSSAHSALGSVASASDSVPTPLEVLTYAHGKARCAGSSTACIVQLHDLALRTINLGDSGFLLCRPLPSPESEKDEDKPLKWQVVYEAPHQSHYFNCPYQLGFGNGDLPDQGQRVELEVREGDLIVLGTDGLYVTQHMPLIRILSQITSLLDTVLPPTPEIDSESMEKVASCIAHTAHKSAKGTKNKTPFAQAAQNAGYEYLGGKMDDITVITALVTASR